MSKSPTPQPPAAVPPAPTIPAHNQRPGLDGIDLANLPAGVQVLSDRNDSITYGGADSSLIAGGVIRQEGVVALGHLTSRLVLNAGGEFGIVGEGVRGAYPKAQREQGAYGIKRRQDGSLLVDCYRTTSETETREGKAAASYVEGTLGRRADFDAVLRSGGVDGSGVRSESGSTSRRRPGKR